MNKKKLKITKLNKPKILHFLRPGAMHKTFFTRIPHKQKLSVSWFLTNVRWEVRSTGSNDFEKMWFMEFWAGRKKAKDYDHRHPADTPPPLGLTAVKYKKIKIKPSPKNKCDYGRHFPKLNKTQASENKDWISRITELEGNYPLQSKENTVNKCS